MDYKDTKKLELAKKIYLYLGAIFITSLVVSNLIFQKSNDELKMFVPIESEWEEVSIWELLVFKAIEIDKHL